MAERWQLFIQGCRDKTVPIIVPKDCHVSHLFSEVSAKCAQGVEAGNLRLLFAGKELQNEPNKRLSDYQITNMAQLVMVLRLPGGMFRLEPLPGFIALTTNQREPDMISLEDSAAMPRARMPCGHAIGSESMTSYCRSLLAQGRYDFRCPHVDSAGKTCDSRWEYFLVRHVANLTVDERQEFERRITENYLSKANGIQKCPGCLTWCSRYNVSNNRVRCIVCVQQGRVAASSQFCWACLGWWRTDSASFCGNVQCDGTDPRVRILATCLTKAIGDVFGCPALRACPGCGIIIEHKEACKHMTCTACRYEFCFICLDSMPQGRHQSASCQLAARQTVLRGMT